MFGAIAGGIASALAGGAMSKLFGGGQKAASGGIQGDVLATDNNTVGMGDAGIKSAIQGSNVPNPDEAVPSFVSGAMANRYKLITNVRSSLMAVNIHITIIELNALHTKRQNLFQELDAVIHLLMEAKHWGLRKSRNATSLNSRFKSLDTLKVKIISVTFRRVIKTNQKKASKIWRHEKIQLGGCQSGRLFPNQIRANPISFTVFPEIVPSTGNSFINPMKNINHTRSSISDDIRNILCSSANMRRAIPLILRLLMN